MPFSRSIATTLASVAIDAWSMPGTQQAFFPDMRARRTSTSCNVLLSIVPHVEHARHVGGRMTIV